MLWNVAGCLITVGGLMSAGYLIGCERGLVAYHHKNEDYRKY